MTDRVMLTDARERFLEGEYDGEDVAKRSQRHRLRQSVDTVLDELIAIAESDETDNSELFDPKKVETLLGAMLGDPTAFERRWEAEDEAEYLEKYDFQHSLIQNLNTIEKWYGFRIMNRRQPSRPPGGLIPEGIDTTAFHDDIDPDADR